ncbi:MAG TPA: hypothetical protein VH482_25700 [Thermomicrobiales bacterium]|jgi:hypothetical protein
MALVAPLLFLLLALFAPVAQTSTQVATPAVQEATPVAVPASDCTVEARTLAALTEIVTAEDIANATPVAEPGPYTKPNGTPADAETVAGVTATIRQLVACVNAGDFLRFLALFSDDALRHYSASLGLPLDPNDELLTPDPSINDQIALGPIADVVVLPDGRVSALAHLPSQSGGTDAGSEDVDLQLIFVHQGDRWLIDELFPVVPQQAGTWKTVSGPGYAGVIVDAETAPEFAKWLTGKDAATGWEPAEVDVAGLEIALPGFLETAPQATERLRQRLSDYIRQYAGIVDSDGRRVILVNAFCDAAGTDWQSQPVFVLDGGDCFFHVGYEPAAGTFSGLMVNGEA